MGRCGEFLLKGGFHGNPGTSLDPPLPAHVIEMPEVVEVLASSAFDSAVF